MLKVSVLSSLRHSDNLLKISYLLGLMFHLCDVGELGLSL